MTIAMGMVFVLLLGEIDLSVGYVSGVGGAIVALLTLPGGQLRVRGRHRDRRRAASPGC